MGGAAAGPAVGLQPLKNGALRVSNRARIASLRFTFQSPFRASSFIGSHIIDSFWRWEVPLGLEDIRLKGGRIWRSGGR
jgi:hypothetical protein